MLRPLDGDVSSVTALVPARNEASVIRASIEGLLAQHVARVVVVDDGSTDETGARLEALARDHRDLVIFAGEGPGPGECGKPAALMRLYVEARPTTPWLLFVDADVVLVPGAAAALLAAAEEEGADLVTTIPRVVMTRTIEKLVMPSIGALVLAEHPPERVADPADPRAFANGQVILVRRELYERIGGHGSVVREILEDVRLAGHAKRAGGRLLVTDGRFVASTHMYEGWAELLEGWSKNLYLLLGATPARAIKWLVLSVALAWAGPLAALTMGWPLGLAAWALILAYQLILRARGGAAPGWAILAPLSALLTARILVRSLVLHTRGRKIPWKGRLYE